jgi:membrane protease YdiL (CAAX protease family)
MDKKSKLGNSTDAVGQMITATDAFEVHRQMVIALFVATLILSVVVTSGLYISDRSGQFRLTALMAVAAAGALGGFVSALRRLYAFQKVFPSNFFGRSRGVSLYLVIYSMIPPLVGVIASVVLYLIFAAGLVKGDLFPDFHSSPVNVKPDDFQNFISNWQPVLATDYAKAIVWGFIAGFSERFVPDILDRIGAMQKKESASEAEQSGGGS